MKPEDISQEAWEKVSGFDIYSDDIRVVCARAIMEAEKRGAEREREACSVTAERCALYENPGLPLSHRQSVLQHNSTCKMVYEAIRQRGTP